MFSSIEYFRFPTISQERYFKDPFQWTYPSIYHFNLTIPSPPTIDEWLAYALALNFQPTLPTLNSNTSSNNTLNSSSSSTSSTVTSSSTSNTSSNIDERNVSESRLGLMKDLAMESKNGILGFLFIFLFLLFIF